RLCRDERPGCVSDRKLLSREHGVRALPSAKTRGWAQTCHLSHEKEIHMKRFHVHLGVENLEQSILFYSRLFGADPAVRKPDYAKWMIDDPRLNFAISSRGGRAGVNHLGLQAEDAEELAAIRANFSAADHATLQD